MARPAKSTPSSSPKAAKNIAKGGKDSNAPKRPSNTYLLWLAENRPRLTKPGMSGPDVLKAAGAEWKALVDKSKWEKLAAQDKARYEKEMAAFKAAGDAPVKPQKK